MQPALSSRWARFGAFEVDLRSGELFKYGLRIRIQDQPFQVLAALLERPGELISRDELRRRLWTDDTFVDFDAGLNAAIRRLREVLSDSSEKSRFIETQPRRGYRFIAPVEMLQEAASPKPAAILVAPGTDQRDVKAGVLGEEGHAGASERAESQRISWRWKLGVACALVLAVGAGMVAWRSRVLARRESLGGIRSIAVLPLQNLSGDPAQEYFADGMTDALITILAQSKSLQVISSASSMRYKGTRKTVQEIGRDLKVDAVIEGAVVRSGDDVRIDAQLVRTSDGRHLWTETYRRTMRDVLALQGEVALAIADEIQIKLTPQEQARLARARPVNPEAYNAYLLGRFFLERAGRDNLQKALGYYEQAIQLDPDYALAWAGIADTRRLLVGGGFVPQAEGVRAAQSAVERALALDADLAEAHAVQGSIHLYIDWNWRAADTSFERALTLEPGNISALRGAATLAAHAGRFDSARQLARLAVDRDPLNPRSHRLVGYVASGAGRLDEAVAALNKAVELNPQGPITHHAIGLVFLEQSRPLEALAEMEQETGPDWRLFGLTLAYHALGREKESDAALAQLVEKYGDTAAFQIAEACGFRGETDSAFEWLDRAYAQHDGALAGIKIDSLFKNLAHDPRYVAFLQKMKLAT